MLIYLCFLLIFIIWGYKIDSHFHSCFSVLQTSKMQNKIVTVQRNKIVILQHVKYGNLEKASAERDKIQFAKIIASLFK